jgi:uncharacterized protein YndB with AHSA1/START domain
VEYDLPFPPAKVWRALHEPKLLEAWLMPGDIAPVVGHKFTMRTQPTGGWDGVVHCEVLLVEPNRRLAYSWKGGAKDNPAYGQPLDTVLTLTLTEKTGRHLAAAGAFRLHRSERIRLHRHERRLEESWRRAPQNTAGNALASAPGYWPQVQWLVRDAASLIGLEP